MKHVRSDGMPTKNMYLVQLLLTKLVHRCPAHLGKGRKNKGPKLRDKKITQNLYFEAWCKNTFTGDHIEQDLRLTSKPIYFS